MPAVYSSLFFIEHDLNGSGALVGPLTGFVWVLRDFVATLGGLDLGNVTLLHATSDTVLWTASFADLSPTTKEWQGRMVIEPEEQVQVVTNVAMDVALSGYALTLP